MQPYREAFGTALVSVRVYERGMLVYERLADPLTQGGQFLDVARLHWPSGTIQEVANVVDAPPASIAPEVTDAMKQSGLCTDELLYP